ncbi:MAG: IS66 family insertion sequence element accessory protein TnpB [Oscillospiraceae bacterium]
MLKDIKVSNIYIVCSHTDMRKSINGLAAIIQEQFDLDLFSDSLFLFCGRRRNVSANQSPNTKNGAGF